MPCTRHPLALLLTTLMAVVMTTAAAEPMKKTTRQKDAMERLRGNPVTPEQARASAEVMKEASAKWAVLKSRITAALDAPNSLLRMAVADLIALHATAKYGENVNGWVNPYPESDVRSLMKQYQFVSYHDPHEAICDVQSRQTGKGFVIGLKVGTECYAHPLTRWTITSPSERQSLLTLDKVKDVVEAWDEEFAEVETERDGSHPQALITSTKITLRNRSIIRGVPGLPQTLRGDTANLVIDEGDHVDNPKEFMKAVLGLVANEEAGKKVVRYITTPNGKNAPSYKYVHDTSGLWSSRVINIWQAVLMGIKQNPLKLEALLDDPEGWAQEFLCEWLDGSNVLLPYELIASCESMEASEHDTPEMLAQSPLRKVAGIDFGRVSDPTVMTLALNGLGINIVRNVTRLKGMSTPDQVRTLKPHLDLCDRIVVDYTGPGIGFGDELARLYGEHDPVKHLFGKVELCTFTLPLKREIFPALRLAFDKRNIRVPISQWFREDLHSMAQVITNGQYNYKAPRSDEGHSDGCTSAALMVRAAGTALQGGCKIIHATAPKQRAAQGGMFGRLAERMGFSMGA